MPGVATAKGEWTPREEDFLRRSWRQRPTSEIAIVLNRPAHIVRAKARRMGLSARRLTLKNHEPALRAMHAEGLSDGEIGRRMNKRRSIISHWRQLLGLPANFSPGAASPGQGEKDLAARNRRARRMGYSSWTVYMVSRRRLKHQWEFPGCVSPGEVIVARLLRDAGDTGLTPREVIRLAHWRTHNAPRHILCRLTRAGMARRVLEQGQKTGRYRYFLVVRCTQAR